MTNRPRGRGNGGANWSLVWPGIALLAAMLGSAWGEETRPIVLERSLRSFPPVGIAPLHFHKPDVAKNVEDLLNSEESLSDTEAQIAAVMAGYASMSSGSGGAGVQDYENYLWYLYYYFKAGVSWAGEYAGAQSARYGLYCLLRDINRNINQTAIKRQVIEKAYFDELAGIAGTAPAKAAPAAGATATAAPPAQPQTLFDLPEGEQEAIVLALRNRVDSLRQYRRDTMENFLIAQRYARDWGIPIADLEKGIEAWSVDDSKVKQLQKDLDAKKYERRGLNESIEVLRNLVDHANELITNNVLHKDRVMEKLKKYRADLDEKNKKLAEAKTAISDLETKIKNAKLGYDPDQKGTKAVAEESASWFKTWGNFFSSRFADISTRRRLHQRSTREASHLYSVAGDFSGFREKTQAALQKAVALLGNGEFKPFELRGALLDKGVVTLCSGELTLEDSTVAQSDYFYALMEKWNNYGGKLETTDEQVLIDRLEVDSLQLAMNLCNGMVSAFFNQAKDLLNLVNPITHWPNELDKTYTKIRNKRIATDKKITFLEDAMDPDLDAAAIRARFGLEVKPEPQEFQMRFESSSHFFPDAEKDKGPLELFRFDSEFYRGMDGGLRRIAVSAHQDITNLLAEEYVISYEKAGYTLRDLNLMALDRQACDRNTGGGNWKLIFSPVKAIVQLHEYFAVNVFGAKRDYLEHCQKRSTELDQMRQTFTTFRDAGFDAVKVAQWITNSPSHQAQLQKHRKLLFENPEYRRFWFKSEKTYQEEHSKKAMARLTDALGAYADEEHSVDMPSKVEELANRVQAIGLLGPSEGFLARAFYQDAIDKAQQFNFEDTLESLLMANELNPKVIGFAKIRDIEQKMFAIQTQRARVEMLVTFTDEIVWDYLLGKVNELIMARLDKLLKTEQAVTKVKTLTAKQQALAVWNRVADAFHNKINPFASSIPIFDLYVKGIKVWTVEQGYKLGIKFQKEYLRNTLLVQGMGMDPDWAEKLFDELWTLASGTAGKIAFDKYQVHKTGLYRYATFWYLKWQLDELSKRLQGKKMPSDIAAVLADQDGYAIWRWIARRRAQVLIQAMQISGEIIDMQEEVDGELEKNPGAWDDFIKKRLKDEAAARRKAFHEATPLNADLAMAIVEGMGYRLDPSTLSAVDADSLGLSIKVLKGEGSREDAQEAAEKAVALLAVFGPTRIKYLKELLADDDEWPSDPKAARMRQTVLDSIDAARRTIHLESFNYMLDLAKAEGGDAEQARKHIVGMAQKLWDARYYDKDKKDVDAAKRDADPDRPKFETMSPDEIKQMVKAIVAITPTGSGGYIDVPGREYKKVRSDLDYTVLLKDDAELTTHQRLALEAILSASFQLNSGGLSADAFDISYMADRESVFLLKSKMMQGPQQLLKQIETADPADMPKLLEELKTALANMRADFKHEERYVTGGRKASLVFQAALGQDLLVLDPETGIFQIRKKQAMVGKPEEMAKLSPTVQKLMRNEGIELQDWMGLGTTVDDVAFLTVKMQKIIAKMNEHPMDSHPYHALIKELSKRCIRVMMGQQTTDANDRNALNQKAKRTLSGEIVDHGTLCDLMMDQVERELKTCPPAQKKDLEELRKTVEAWKKVKLGVADANDIVAMETGRKTLSPGCPNYRRALDAFTKKALGAMEIMAVKTISDSVETLRPVVEKRTELKKQIQTLEASKPPGYANQVAQLGQQLAAVETVISMNIDPIASRYSNLTGYNPYSPPAVGQPSAVQKALIDALKKIDIPENEFMDRVKSVKPTAWLWRPIWLDQVDAWLELGSGWTVEEYPFQEAA